MSTLERRSGVLHLGGLSLSRVAELEGTPTYVYDLDAIAAEARATIAAFGDQPRHVSYAVKANSAGPIIRALAREGCGADVVSGAELMLSRACGILARDIVYSGVAKTNAEIDLAIAEGIAAIQAESVEELARIAARAKEASKSVRVSLRINPEIDKSVIDTHHHIATGHDEAKFGIARSDVPAALDVIRGSSLLQLIGVTAHIGSQLTRVDPYVAGVRTLCAIAADLRTEFPIEMVDAGGGFGIDYGSGCEVRPADFVRAACVAFREAGMSGLTLGIEPGRAFVAAHAVLLAHVTQRKQPSKSGMRWMILDAGMNDLIRPALYQAKHRIVPIEIEPADTIPWRVVGPVCESSDDFGEHELPKASFAHVAILDCGAYGYTMASRYNGRSLPAEAFIASGAIAFRSPRALPDAWVNERLLERH